jgi:phosphoribosylformimino-5-aminoimidazole carboxamide ribotide isomerase
MEIYPAVDLRDGNVVRLQYGDPDRETVFGDDPVSVARLWAESGARWLHVVDLDGAFGADCNSSSKNRACVKNITAVGPRVQFGGGLRSLLAIERAFSAGVSRAIIGTMAVERPDLVEEAVRIFGAERIAVGVDARDGRVMTRGWKQDGGIDLIDLGRRLRSLGVEIVIHTDIARDGDLSGVNVAASSKLAQAIGLRVIASGGVKSIEDVKEVKRMPDIEGVIIGRALYAGTVDLKAAIALGVGHAG